MAFIVMKQALATAQILFYFEIFCVGVCQKSTTAAELQILSANLLKWNSYSLSQYYNSMILSLVFFLLVAHSGTGFIFVNRQLWGIKRYRHDMLLKRQPFSLLFFVSTVLLSFSLSHNDRCLEMFLYVHYCISFAVFDDLIPAKYSKNELRQEEKNYSF